MKKLFNRKGFTLAEVLIVVAIIVILASVGAVALFSHMRNMQKLEMDGQAKDLFVAAQNHLSLASSQGFLGVAEYTETGGLTENFGTAEMGDDGKFKDSDKILENIKNEWADFITTKETHGADTATPPSNNGGGKMSKADIMKIKDNVIFTGESDHCLLDKNGKIMSLNDKSVKDFTEKLKDLII